MKRRIMVEQISELFEDKNIVQRIKNNDTHEIKNCSHCGEPIYFVAEMAEEWSWNGYTWECSAHNSLIYDYHMPVKCGNSYNIAGKGTDSGFEK